MKKFLIIALCLLLITASLCGCKKKNADEEEFLRQVAQYREAKMTFYEEENQKYADYEVDAAFLGDSLTDGYDLQKFYPQYTVANRGIGGDTTVDLEGRLKTSVYDLKPKVAIMLIGANNPDSMLDNYENILIGLKNNLPKTKIILLSMTSMGGEHWGKRNKTAAYNNVSIKMLAEKYGFEFVDLYSPLLNLETGEIYDEYTADGGHLTPLGYDVLTLEITPVLEAQLQIWATENE